MREHFKLLSLAAGRVASPQIRNAGTLGGNLCQDTRCWYYRCGVDCYRAGGNMCYADTPEGQNREHAIFGASRCVAVQPSDTANALVALDASIVLRGPRGERIVPASEFFVGPALDIRHMTALREGEILTAVRVPATWRDATFYFEKVADRAAWTSRCCRSPRRSSSTATRSALRAWCAAPWPACPGASRRWSAPSPAARATTRPPTEAGKLAVDGARTLNFNHFKVPLMENLVRRAIRGAGAAA